MKSLFLQRRWLVVFFSSISLFFSAVSLAAVKVYDSPVGYWQTIDHDTNNPSSVIKIWREKNGTLSGKINYIYAEHGHKASDVCHKCKGDLRDKPVLGMKMIWDFKPTDDPNFYHRGRILDPTNGKTYKCQMTLKNHGQVLDVHGYIGIPLFGRSDTWYRVHPIQK